MRFVLTVKKIKDSDMGQIISISINNEVKSAGCQAVSIVEKRSGLPSIKSASYINVADIPRLAAKNNIKIACAYDGIITENVDIPPVNNQKSKIFLLKNKMKDHLKKELEYSFAYFENIGKAEPPNINYTVYAAPIYVLKDEVKIPQKNISSVQSFTFDFFAIMGVSNAVDPTGSIFHIYADKDRIIIVLSTGTKVEYYRANNVPPQVSTPEGLTSFYYENINLTYLYVRQNFSNLKMKIILSGKLNTDASLLGSLKTFIDIPIINISAKNLVSGASDKVFNEFLVPIGHSLLRGKLDFSSDQHRGERLFLKVVSAMNALMLLAISVCGAYSYQLYGVYTENQRKLELSSKRFLGQEVALISKIGDVNLLKSRATYLKLIEEQNSTPLLLLAPSQEIMNFYLFSKIEFTGLGDSASVVFYGEKKQDNYSSLEEFRNQIQEEIYRVADKHVRTDDTGSSHTLRDLHNKISVKITPGTLLTEIQTRMKEQSAAKQDNVTVPDNMTVVPIDNNGGQVNTTINAPIPPQAGGVAAPNNPQNVQRQRQGGNVQ